MENDLPPESDVDVDAALTTDRELRSREGKLLSQMTPAEISTEVLAAIHRHVNPDDVGRVLGRMLKATRQLKNGTVLDDTRAQDSAAKIYLSYTIGTPVQRSESVNVNLGADDALGLRERLQHSPALRSVIQKMLKETEGQTQEIDVREITP